MSPTSRLEAAGMDARQFQKITTGLPYSETTTVLDVRVAKDFQESFLQAQRKLADDWQLLQWTDMKDVWDDLCKVAQPKWDYSFEILSHAANGHAQTTEGRIKSRILQRQRWLEQKPRGPPPKPYFGSTDQDDADLANFWSGNMEPRRRTRDLFPSKESMDKAKAKVFQWLSELP
ncbi:hypothetical protein BU16DRAFT_563862 [Lophium mytilinum]|uniref:Uncharacterized protein n=1 Tax=Lophium mytilinum TaxID=390894 RepID=A0A6A6QJE0_9PEZI|nr:hypothetical protein BU16DRAFT_563862 [Lophium mytilinum]